MRDAATRDWLEEAGVPGGPVCEVQGHDMVFHRYVEPGPSSDDLAAVQRCTVCGAEEQFMVYEEGTE